MINRGGLMRGAVLIDLRHAVRALRRAPSPVIVSVLSLSLGIGAAATMISAVDAIDVRPLPYRNAERLVELSQVESARPGCADCRSKASPGLFRHWQDATRSYEALSAASSIVVALDNDDRLLGAARASDTFFATLNVEPLVGRIFTPEEARQGARVLVIAHDLWQVRFGGDSRVIGRAVSLSWAGDYRGVAAEAFTIVGVLPRGARYPVGSQIWLPASGGFGGSHRDHTLTVVGRLLPGVTTDAARAELEVVSEHLAAAQPDPYSRWQGQLTSLRDAIRTAADERAASARFPLLLVAVMVLALATVNVANLFLARTTADEHDLLIRTALGAPRSRIVRLLLAQSISVSLAAGALGMLVARWGVDLVEARLAISASGAAPLIDGRLIISVVALSLITGFAVGLLPVVRLGRPELNGTIRTRSGRGGSPARPRRLQDTLVVVQVASALVLSSGAWLLAREFVSLVGREPGFDPERLLVASLPLSRSPNPVASNIEARLAEGRVASLPGITAAALGGLPAEGYAYRLERGDTLRGAAMPLSYRVSPGYFRTLGIRLLAGREFLASDRAGATPSGIVSRTATRTWWPGEDPIGRRLFMANAAGVGEWVTIVGVAEDERVRRNMRAPIGPVLYRPFDQLTGERRLSHIFARTEGRPAPSIPAVRAVIEGLRGGAGWQGERVAAMTEILGGTLDQPRFRMWALTLVSAFGLLLAAMGIYGVVSTIVSQRTTEIGIRVALGARPVDVLVLVSRRGIGLAAGGIALGVAGSFALSRVLQALLVNSAGTDSSAPLAAGVFLAADVIFACYVPARRAARVDPITALRES